MLFDLNKLRGSREHLERTFQPSAFDPQDDEYRVAAPVELTLDVQKQGNEAFAVSGRARTELEVECGRCVEPIRVPVDATFDLRYMPAGREHG